MGVVGGFFCFVFVWFLSLSLSPSAYSAVKMWTFDIIDEPEVSSFSCPTFRFVFISTLKTTTFSFFLIFVFFPGNCYESSSYTMYYWNWKLCGFPVGSVILFFFCFFLCVCLDLTLFFDNDMKELCVCAWLSVCAWLRCGVPQNLRTILKIN